MSNKILEALKKGDVFNAHRTFGKRYFFPSEDMEFGFLFFLGMVAHGGCALGEMLYLAQQVNPKRPETWVEASIEMAERVDARARQSLAGGHKVSARQGLLRASNYHRWATAMLSPRKDRDEWEAQFLQARTLFQEAAALFDPPMEVLQIPFEGAMLPGYFLKPDNDTSPRKTLLVIGGGETFAEDLYFHIAPAALARGYNFATADLPGQGGLPLEGLTFRTDMDVPMRTVVDALLNRKDIDPDQLAAYGISAGGYIVPRAAAYDKRIKACVANSLLYDLNRVFKASVLQFGNLFKKHDPMTWYILDMIAWRWGASNPLDLMAKNREAKFDPTLLTCPTLIVIGEGEYAGSKEAQFQQHSGLEAVQHEQKDLVITPLDEGAGHHVLGDNLALMSQVVLDWLDKIFA
jgi:alpha-beta hydrolase superfamily lysophospholipase